MPSILIDTNVLVYAYDARDQAKNIQAINLLTRLQPYQSAYLSVQTLAEFMNATRKLKIAPADAHRYIMGFAATWPIIDLTPQVVIEAARGVRDHSLAYYDAQIWATARLNQIPVIFSEDFNTGSALEGVRFVNPFAATFKLDDWI
jgi:predicted nucleic acid-binding protein